MVERDDNENNRAAAQEEGRRVGSERRRSSIAEAGDMIRRGLERIFSSRHNNTLAVSKEEEEDAREAQLDEIMKELSPAEVETAARASYAYQRLLLKSAESSQQQQQKEDPNRTTFYARKYARRFLEAKKGNVAKATARLHETLAFRQEQQIDELRTAFDRRRKIHERDATNGAEEDDGDAHRVAKRLEKEVRAKNCYVQGFDKAGRSTYIFVPRNVHTHHDEWTLKEHIYTLERALACSKLSGDGEAVNAVVDFTGFSLRRNSPPTHIGKQFMTTFRNHYAGSIHAIYLVNAPTSFHWLWSLFSGMVAQKTRDKIHFVSTSSSSTTKKNPMAETYALEEAASWMVKGGLKNRELDVDEYLFSTPFHCAFDETTADTAPSPPGEQSPGQ